MNKNMVLEQALGGLSRHLPEARPVCGLILGSGWSALGKMFTQLARLSYEEIPGLGATAVSSHTGMLMLGEYAGLQTLVFQGRHHWYENRGWDPVLLPIGICHALGVRQVVLTNAAGGIRDDLMPGDLMIISDHINAMGVNPMTAPLAAGRKTFFSDQSAIYRPQLRDLARRSAATAGLRFSDGVYLAVAGPAYETPAEVRMYRTMGADAIGMSTVPEAMLANALGMQVLGLSCITNRAAGLQRDQAVLDHGEVTAAAKRVLPPLRKTLELVWRHMACNNGQDA